MTRTKSRSASRRRSQTFWLLAGWVLGLVVVVGLYLRWTTGSTSLRVAVISLTPLLFIAVLGMVVAAWRVWDRRLALATVAIAAAYLGTFTSIDSVIGCQAETAEDALVIHTHNVWWPNGDPTAVGASALASGADVIVLQEVWPSFMDVLETDPTLADYRYRTSDPAEDTTGLAIWSRYPISEATSQRLGGVPIMRARIDGPHGQFTVDNIHLTAPVAGGLVSSWEAQLAELQAIDPSGPTILAGDFNATMDHSQFRALVDRGWTDVHEPKGCGFDATWPTGRAAPTLLRLDHVLVTERFDVLAVEIGPGDGSDHRSVTATVRLKN